MDRSTPRGDRSKLKDYLRESVSLALFVDLLQIGSHLSLTIQGESADIAASIYSLKHAKNLPETIQ